MYLMDYNSYGYNYVSSFSKTEDANIKIPWYYWELCVTPLNIAVTNDFLIMNTIEKAGVKQDQYIFMFNTHYFNGEYGDDETISVRYDEDRDTFVATLDVHGIPSFIQTKLFDFGQPSRLKTVSMFNLSFEYNDGKPIKVEFISERPTVDEHTVIIEGGDSEKYSPEHIHPCRLFPYTKGTAMFGARINCEGNMNITSITLQYKALGGAK